MFALGFEIINIRRMEDQVSADASSLMLDTPIIHIGHGAHS